MTDTSPEAVAKLCERLRDEHEILAQFPMASVLACRETADALEALAAERDQFRSDYFRQHEELNNRIDSKNLDVVAAVARTEAAEKERDALRAEALSVIEPFAELRVNRYMTYGLRYDYRIDPRWLHCASALVEKLKRDIK